MILPAQSYNIDAGSLYRLLTKHAYPVGDKFQYPLYLLMVWVCPT